MGIRSQFDNADLGEMLLIADAAYHAGFKQVSMDPQVQISLLCELIELRHKKAASNVSLRAE
jgi:hypothetical protein